jgi:LysM repeat protein
MNPNKQAVLTPQPSARTRWTQGVLAACMFVLLVACALIPMPAAGQENTVIMSEDFEGEFKADPTCKTGTCLVPAGWGVWFIPRRETDQPGINFQPQYMQVKLPNRVKGGAASQRVYTENATHTGGIFRIVTNVKPGAKLRFSAWGESWSTNDESPISARPSPDIKLKIGIDPMGGNNGQASPLNGQVIWSEEHDAKDAYTQFSIETEAKSATVIVYMYSTMKDPVRHNEIYWDDAVLEYTSPPPEPTLTPTVASAAEVTGTPQTTTPGATAAATSAPASVQVTGGITHTVAEGDTLFAIALQYNKSVEEIKRLNSLSSDVLQIGQVLIIEPPAELVNPGGQAPAVQPTAVVTMTSTPGIGALCVLAYFDNNGNGQRDSGEDPIPNVLFNVTAKGAPAASYTTDGVNEPYCIGNLTEGDYTAAATITPAYNATTPLNDTVAIPSGGRAQFNVGLRRVSDGNQVIAVTGTPTATASSGGGPSVLAILATLGGAILILGTIGFGVLFFLQSRRL